MSSFADFILEVILEVIKAIIFILIWGWILYIVGYIVLWAFSLGKYPKGLRLKRRSDLVAGTGLLFLIVLWFGVAGYNNFIRQG